MKEIDIKLEDKYGMLTIVSFAGRIRRNRCWNCLCECGKKCIVSTSDLRYRKNCGSYIHRRGKNNSHFKGHEEIYKSYWYMLKFNARRRKLKFNISIKDAWNLFLKQNRKCALTGLPLIFKSQSCLTDGTASVDRIDHLKGYEKNNIQWVHKDYNMMKNSWTDEQFIKMCQQVSDFKKNNL